MNVSKSGIFSSRIFISLGIMCWVLNLVYFAGLQFICSPVL
jgi:hypothetical protein